MAARKQWKKGHLIGRVYAPLGENGEQTLLVEVVATGNSDETGLPLCEYRYLVSEEKCISYMQDKLNHIVQEGFRRV